MSSIKIIGTGSALPKRVMKNEELTKWMDTSDEWIRERTGIAQRHISTGETVASLAGEAAKKAIENAGIEATDLDMLLVATCSPECMIPSVSCQVQAYVGAQNAVAFDLNAACAGFLFCLHTAYAYVNSGIYEKILIVGSEVLSKLYDPGDRGTGILFGDGAGAAVVTKCDDGEGLIAFTQMADGSRGGALTCENRVLKNALYESEQAYPGFIQMDGREIFKFAVRQIPMCIEETLSKTKFNKEDITYYVLHQANARIVESIANRLVVSMEHFPYNVDRVGNTSSASIPILLDELNRNGKLKKGMKLVLSGFGAGLTYGACVLSW